jgi:hypothetical protein
MTTDLDARWAVLAAETQHDGMRSVTASALTITAVVLRPWHFR